MKRVILIVLPFLLVGCGGGGGGGTGGGTPVPGGEAAFACSYVGGGSATISSGCVQCRQNAISARESAIDMDLSTAATANTYSDDLAQQQTVMTIRATAQDGIVFPSGSRAGVAMRLPTADFASYAVTINTYLDGAPQETHQATPDPQPNGELVYYGFDMGTASTFDAVELVLSESQPNLEEHVYQIIEFCSDGALN